MDLEWEQIVVDAAQPAALGRWWADALGWVLVSDPDPGPDSGDEDEIEVEIRPSLDRLPGLLFVPAGGPKTVKNRWHPDFRPVDQAAEVARLVALGARPVDIGQGTPSWVVLADPEGNEFCVLASRRAAGGVQGHEAPPG